VPDWNTDNFSDLGWGRCDKADIVPFVYAGHAFPGGVARPLAALFALGLDLLCQAPGFQLAPSHGLDAGMWGFECREVTGGGSWSWHAAGAAIDLNAPWNPYGSNLPPVSPFRLPLSTDVLLRQFGLRWAGGSAGWGDWMHIQAAVDAGEAAAIVAAHSGPQKPVGPHPYPLPGGYYYGPYSGPMQSISGMGHGDDQWRPGLRQVQAKLRTVADGLYGPNTEAVVKAWQKGHGLVPDGLVGPRTWRSLWT
jgi:peptidoglycan hydrolase-like protein with peptidoglycan-binding domain